MNYEAFYRELELIKLGAMANAILPAATARASRVGFRSLPQAGKAPFISSIAAAEGWNPLHVASSATPATATARTVAPQRMKAAADMTAGQRAEISKKDFALTSRQSSTKKPAYPVHDEKHARLALAFVKMHGSSGQQGEVYKDVARKYPHLAAHSSIPALQAQVKKAGVLATVGKHLVKHEDPHEIAGLGTLALPGVDYVQARLRSMAAGDKSTDAVQKRRFMNTDAQEAAELGGLGYLAAGSAAKLRYGKHA